MLFENKRKPKNKLNGQRFKIKQVLSHLKAWVTTLAAQARDDILLIASCYALAMGLRFWIATASATLRNDTFLCNYVFGNVW